MERKTNHCMMINNGSYKSFLIILGIWGISPAFRTYKIDPV